MICPQCGYDNPQGNAFCTQCGHSLAAHQAKAAAQPMPAPTPQPAATQQPVAQPYAQAYQQPQQQPTQQMPPVAAYQDPRAAKRAAKEAARQAKQAAAYQQASQYGYAAPVQAEGPLGAAWRDITSTPNWMKRIIILALISLVPILNFAVVGYAMKWARDLSFGKRQTMPNKIFEEGEIKYGFFATLVDIALSSAVCIVVTIALVIIGAIFGLFSLVAATVIVSILSVIIGILMVIFLAPFLMVSNMRMVIVGPLESAFNVRKTWAAFRSKMGGAVVAVLVPVIVSGIIASILFAIFSAITAGAVYSGISGMEYFNNYYYYDDPSAMFGPAAQMISSLGFGVLLVGIIFYVITMFISTFASILSYRAMGHWAARTAPVWAVESKDPDAADEIMLDSKAGAVITIPDQPVYTYAPPAGQPVGQAQVYRQPSGQPAYPTAKPVQAAEPAQAPAYAQPVATAAPAASPYAAAQPAPQPEPQSQPAPTAAPAVQPAQPVQEAPKPVSAYRFTDDEIAAIEAKYADAPAQAAEAAEEAAADAADKPAE